MKHQPISIVWPNYWRSLLLLERYRVTDPYGMISRISGSER